MAVDMPTARYGLYGEPAEPAAPRFLHVEPIRLRSGLFAWSIAPHAHEDLHQILLVTAGGGTMRAEAETLAIGLPALLVAPAGCVHAFDFLPGTDGWIASLAQTTLPGAVRGEGAVAALFSGPSCTHPLPPGPAATLEDAFAALSRELVLSAPARGLAIEAEVLRILAAAARVAAEARPNAALAAPDAVLTDHFRQLVERRFREGASVADYARELGVSQDRLLAACRRRFGEPPAALVQRRLLVEAQRWLIYTDRPIRGVGEALGFSDPAYFSRFFRKRAGTTPRAYRARARR